MDTFFSAVDDNSLPAIWVSNKTVLSINHMFTSLTGYGINEIVNEDLNAIFGLLKATPYTSIEDIETEKDVYIFSKSNESIKVTLYKEIDASKQVVRITFIEKPDSRIKDIFPFAYHLLCANTVGVAIFTVPEIVMLDANEIFLSFLDEPYNKRENCIGKQIGEIVTGWEGSSSEELWNELLDTGKPMHIDDYRYDNFNRGETHWNITMTPVYENERLAYYVEITMDITETVLNKRRIEEQNKIIEHQKREFEKMLKLQEEFFSYISHEFKTPITVTNASIQAMEFLCKDEMSDRTKEFIKKIKRSSLQQMRLVNNLLDITRADAGYLRMDMRNLDIVETTRLIIESVIPFARQKGVNLYFSTRLAEKILALDDEKYERILLNLLSNAIKFTPGGKSIHVEVTSLENRICVGIIDEGPGIPRDQQQIIFEKFGQVGNTLTRKSEGTGIGLCLVKLLVNALGGELILESEEGMGCCFNILLPIAKTANKRPKDIMPDLMGNRLIEHLKVEFSDIYFS